LQSKEFIDIVGSMHTLGLAIDQVMQ